MGKDSTKKQAKPAAAGKREKRPRPEEVVSREYTVNMHKRVHGVSAAQRQRQRWQGRKQGRSRGGGEGGASKEISALIASVAVLARLAA